MNIQDDSNCEHCDHTAPAGKRFCSDACCDCEHDMSNLEIGCTNLCGLANMHLEPYIEKCDDLCEKLKNWLRINYEDAEMSLEDWDNLILRLQETTTSYYEPQSN